MAKHTTPAMMKPIDKKNFMFTIPSGKVRYKWKYFTWGELQENKVTSK